MEITYESIKTLIVSERVDGQNVHAEFKAPGQESPIAGMAVVMPEQSEIVANVGKNAVKQGVISSVISSISSFLGGLVGGTAGSITSSATSQMGHAAASNSTSGQDMMKTKVTPEKQQKAVVEAFKTVQTFFKYNEETKQWEAVKFG
jgi:hypothetical protein